MSTFIILWLIWACMAAIIAGKKIHSAVSFYAGLILGAPMPPEPRSRWIV